MLTQPLRDEGTGGVPEVMERMDEMGISKDDWDTLVAEFGLGKQAFPVKYRHPSL